MKTFIACVFALTVSIVISVLISPSVQAQSQTSAKPAFEVASVKISKECGKIPLGPSYQPGGRYFTCSILRWIIMDAYQLDPFVPPTGGPDWSNDTAFQIDAKAEGNPAKGQVRLMVQSLLEERFKLKMHTEKRPTPVYLLVIAKGGHKLQPAKDEKGNLIVSLPDQNEIGQLRKIYPTSERVSMIPGDWAITMGTSEHKFTGKAITMEKFSELLFSNVGRQKVVDKTGLTGFYDIQLVYANPNNVSAASDSSAPSIFTAIKEQLGLKLEESKAPLDHYVIDSVEKPSEN